MEKSNLILCDTDILIEIYRNNTQIIQSIRKIGENNLVISIITAGELLRGARNKKELKTIQRDLQGLDIIDIDKSISEIFIQLIATFSLSHNLCIPDAFIAATSIARDIPLYTLNTKDYKFIPGISLFKPRIPLNR